jgi:hypothetical protein
MTTSEKSFEELRQDILSALAAKRRLPAEDDFDKLCEQLNQARRRFGAQQPTRKSTSTAWPRPVDR